MSGAKSLMRKITLLLLPMPSATMISLLSASVMKLYADYPQYSESLVTLLLTIPNLTVMLAYVLPKLVAKRQH